jgi:hypothetical protein
MDVDWDDYDDWHGECCWRCRENPDEDWRVLERQWKLQGDKLSFNNLQRVLRRRGASKFIIHILGARGPLRYTLPKDEKIPSARVKIGNRKKVKIFPPQFVRGHMVRRWSESRQRYVQKRRTLASFRKARTVYAFFKDQANEFAEYLFPHFARRVRLASS